MMQEQVHEILTDWANDAQRRLQRQPLPPIRVLVWGPGLIREETEEQRRALQEKRREIIERLRAGGLAATTSEELAVLAASDRHAASIPLNAVEETQAQEVSARRIARQTSS